MTKRGWPTGFYESVAPAGPRAVSLSELPQVRATLLLRLMASGETLKEAVRELKALPEGDREPLIMGPILVQLQGDLPRMGVTVTWSTPEEHSTMMSHEEAVRIFTERETRAMAMEQALAGSLQGAQRLFERRMGRALTEAERGVVAARFHTPGPERLADVVFDLDAPALAAWLADPHAA